MNILAFGDSITWGACDDEGAGWATRLRNDLISRDIDVYNCGISGDTTLNLLKRFSIEAQARKSKTETVILFAIGINDSRYTGSRENSQVSKAHFVANLETLITQAHELDFKVIFIGITRVEERKVMPIPWSKGDKNYDNTNISLFDSLLKETATRRGAPYLDVSNLLAESDLEDGLHPNTQGHIKLCDAIKEFLVSEKVLK